MVKARSVNGLARRRQRYTDLTPQRSSATESMLFGSTMMRDPISVPNFRTMALPTPVLTPVEASRLVFVDLEESSDDDKRNKDPAISQLIELPEEEIR